MTTALGSAFYLGRVMHQRFRPRAHTLRYRVFYLLLDIDEVEQLDRSLRFFSRNRLNLFSFQDRDHGDGSGAALRGYAERQLAAADIAFDGGAIRLLAMPASSAMSSIRSASISAFGAMAKRPRSSTRSTTRSVNVTAMSFQPAGRRVKSSTRKAPRRSMSRPFSART